MLPRELVRSLYDGVLGREPSDGEVDGWVAAIDGGAPLSDVVRSFVESPERLQIQRRLGARGPRLVPFHLCEELVEAAGRISIVDVGAQALESEDDVHLPLLESGRATVVGFEPLEEKSRSGEADWVMYPVALGDGTVRTFYETVWSPTSSLYEPDIDVMSDFAGLAEQCEVRAERPLETARLDDVLSQSDLATIDFLKLDVQGAELDVLRGADRWLGKTLVVHTEVEFHPIYRDQPLAEHVFEYLRSRHFDLFDVPRIERYRYGRDDNELLGSRALWGEAVFVPNSARLDQLSVEATLRLCWVMHDVYRAADFVAWLLERLDATTGTQFCTAYRKLLTRQLE